ncbi:MAG: alkaline phosphatase D family protein [Armatimonadota bacterium]|nr:alkaline phosphatase D family protein [Armatimonadota bacterium]
MASPPGGLVEGAPEDPRRHMDRILRVVLALALAATVVAAEVGPAPGLRAAEPPVVFSGDVTDSSAVLWVRTGTPGAVRVEYGPTAALGRSTTPVTVTEATDFTAKVELSDLQAAARYFYRVVAEPGGTASLVGELQTAPPPDAAAALALAWGADTNERFRPFRIFDAIRAAQPDAFLFLGDTIYSDLDCGAQTLAEYRECYRRNRADEPFRRFLRTVPVWTTWDDHEVANNFDRTHPRLAIGRQAFLEYWPIRTPPADPTRLHRSFRWGRLVEIFILDTRQYRSPAYDRDTPAKTMLGEQQRQWLLRGLAESRAHFKVVATSVPLKFHGADSWEGYTAERQVILDTVARGIRGVVFVSGDVHYAAVIRHREGVLEGIAGPLAAVINTRRRAAEYPETVFSFNRSFTFGLLRIEPSPPQLAVELYDVDGRLLYRTVTGP